MTLLRFELCFLSPWLPLDHPNLNTWNPKEKIKIASSLVDRGQSIKYVILYMNKYEPCMDCRKNCLQNIKEQEYVLPENANFRFVFIIYYLGNVGFRIMQKK